MLVWVMASWNDMQFDLKKYFLAAGHNAHLARHTALD
jgi:hypothetical protein